MFLILIYFICFHKSSADPLQIYLKNISENKISNDDSNEQSPNETMNIIYDAESFHFSSYYIEFFRKSKFKKVLNNDIDIILITTVVEESLFILAMMLINWII